MNNKKLKPIPQFRTEDEERTFWDKAVFSDYFDTDNPMKFDLSDLKPSTESISIRFPSYMLQRIKQLANAKDVPYQSLIKVYLSERVAKELNNKSSKAGK